MIKYFCDACNKEAKRLYSFSYLCHLSRSPLDSHIENQADGSFERVSGRDDKADLCLRCYNSILQPAVKQLLQLKQENQ